MSWEISGLEAILAKIKSKFAGVTPDSIKRVIDGYRIKDIDLKQKSIPINDVVDICCLIEYSEHFRPSKNSATDLLMGELKNLLNNKRDVGKKLRPLYSFVADHSRPLRELSSVSAIEWYILDSNGEVFGLLGLHGWHQTYSSGYYDSMFLTPYAVAKLLRMFNEYKTLQLSYGNDELQEIIDKFNAFKSETTGDKTDGG